MVFKAQLLLDSVVLDVSQLPCGEFRVVHLESPGAGGRGELKYGSGTADAQLVNEVPARALALTPAAGEFPGVGAEGRVVRHGGQGEAM